ncbi:MAG: hypothetical protein FWF59_08180 [Turicibacter sp.]|nr:hypothetical protein [Turicibacter sp.]
MDKRDPNQSWNKGMTFGRTAKKAPVKQPVRESAADENFRCAAPMEEPVAIKMPAAMEHRPEKKKTKTQQGPHSLKNKKPVSTKPAKKTPLQEFDVKAFFEENLYDIIDLEENRSGVCEFEDAYKDE